MNKKNKLNKVLGVFSGVEDNAAFKNVDEQLAEIGVKLKETMAVKTVEEVNREFKTLQKLFTPLLPAFESLKRELLSQEGNLKKQLQDKLDEFNQALSDTRGATKDRNETLQVEITSLKAQIQEVQGRKIELPNYEEQIKNLSVRFTEVLKGLKGYIDKGDKNDFETQIKELNDSFLTLRTAVSQHGGGSMNRQIRVEGVNVLTKYTDINLYGVTSSVISSVDNVNKRVNIGIQGGGGGTPGGADTQVQFNNGGTTFGGSAKFTFNKTTGDFTVGDGLSNSGNVILQSNTGSNFIDKIASSSSLYDAPHFQGYRARGTLASPQAVTVGDAGVIYSSFMYDGSNYQENGVILIVADGAISNGIVPGLISLAPANSAGVLSAGLTVDSNLLSTFYGPIALKGKTSGAVTIQPASIAGSWTMTLPTVAGSNGQVLQTDGNGITTWATAGASSVASAINRISSIITASQTAASTSLTDYIYFANAGLSVTLPTAVGNNNLYTIKNISNSSVLVLTTSAQTIDGSANALLPVQNQSLDLLSNNANWQVI